MTETFNVSYLSKRWFNWHMHPRFLLQAMGGFKHAIALLFSVSCPLEFHNLPTRCQYGTKQTCHSVLSDACLDAVQQAMFGCGWYSWDYVPVTCHWIVLNQCPTVGKKVTDRRRICRQSIENKITLLWLLQDHVLIKKTSKKNNPILGETDAYKSGLFVGLSWLDFNRNRLVFYFLYIHVTHANTELPFFKLIHLWMALAFINLRHLLNENLRTRYGN